MRCGGIHAQSLNHVRAMAQYGSARDDGQGGEGANSSGAGQGASEGVENGNTPLTTSLTPVDNAIPPGVGLIASAQTAAEGAAEMASPGLASVSEPPPPRDASSNDAQSSSVIGGKPDGSDSAPAAAATSLAVSLTKVEKSDSNDEMQIQSVVETRLTGFMVHVLVLASLAFVPVLRSVPLAVIAGVFLHLGLKVMSGNQFLGRCKVRACARAILSSGTRGARV